MCRKPKTTKMVVFEHAQKASLSDIYGGAETYVIGI